MKLRIAHIDTSDRMAGRFAVQSSFLGILWDTIWFDTFKQVLLGRFAVQSSFLGILWDTIWFDTFKQVLLEEFVLNKATIVKAEFDDFLDAMRYAKIFKQSYDKRMIIRETWRV